MTAVDSVPDRLIEACLTLAARQGWRPLSMAAIAQEAGVSLAEARKHVRSKGDLVAALFSRADQQVLQDAEAERDEPVRDRLFALVMRRLDVLQSHRNAVQAMLHDLPRDPLLALPLIPQFAISMQWMLDAAGVPTAGLLGALRVHALAAIYLNTLRVWMNDDSADLSVTMAALDKTLTRVDELVRRLPCPDRAAPPTSADGDVTDSDPDPGLTMHRPGGPAPA